MSADPVIFKLDREADGFELARRWVEMPRPGGFLSLLKARPIEIERGFMRVRCDVDVGHSNFVGLVHGGVIAGLTDIAGGGAAMTLLRPGETLLTTDLNTRFLDAAPIETARLEATGRVSFHGGRRIVVAVEVSGDNDAIIAQGSVGVSVRAPR
ncbi:MAG: PaaI family thioesterase [Hyphomonadaceae bacterium]